MNSIRLKHVCSFRAGGTPRSDDERFWADETGIPWVAISDMTSQSFVTHTAKTITARGAAQARLTPAGPGTILLAMYASVGETATLGVSAVWNQAILGITPLPGVADARFVRYWLEAIRPTWSELVRTNTQDNLSAELVRNMPFPGISADVQSKIADRLDLETAQIDSLIAKRKALVTLLLEKRTSTTALGVAGEMFMVPRKASRLPWVTDVPAHWDELKLTLLARLGSGHTPSREHPEWWTDCRIPWITTGEVWQMRDDRLEYLEETREMISAQGIANSSAELCPAGTVVLSRTASAGFSAIMGREMATSQDFMTWQCGPRLRPRYLLLCLRAMRCDLLDRLAMGSTHQTIYVPDIQSIRVPVPPVEEQDEIVDFVWARLGRINASIDAIDSQVRLLQDRRQALIVAATVGDLTTSGVAT